MVQSLVMLDPSTLTMFQNAFLDRASPGAEVGVEGSHPPMMKLI